MRKLGFAVAAVLAVLVLAACGQKKVQRSSKPAQVRSAGSAPVGPTGTTQANGTFDGQVVGTQYGPVQVAISVAGGRITDLKALQYPVDRPRSQFINSQAIPLLRSEALQVQSARIDLISGATYTSDAFATSLQSAISQER